jgi:large subunit ribosomal protein L30
VEKKLKITQIKSYIGRPGAQRKVLRGMGLGKINRTVVLLDTPEIRGMIRKVVHLVTAVEVEGSGK